MARAMWSRVPTVLVALALFTVSAAAQDLTVERLGRVLHLDEVVTLLREEGLDYGRDLEESMLGGSGGSVWDRQVDHIHDAGRMRADMMAALGQGMDEDAVAGSLAFFDTPRGQKILSLETAARRAMADPAVEEIAQATYDRLAGGQGEAEDRARFDAVRQFVSVNDLVERNVAGTMSATYQFFRGLADGGAIDMDDREILADVWSDEADTRRDTERWIHGFLLMAYRSLDDGDMQAYIAFSDTPAGRALNAALFAGFDAIYAQVSYELGLAVAHASAASDL